MAKRPVMMTDLFKLKALAQPISDGRRVFFLETQMNQVHNDYQTAIKSIDLDSRHLTTWVAAMPGTTDLVLSPQREHLGYLAVVNDKTQVFCMALDSGVTEQVTHAAAGVSAFFWSADGSSVYFQTTDQSETATLPQPTVVTKMQYKLNGVGVLAPTQHYLYRQLIGATATHLIWRQVADFEVTAHSADGRYATFTSKRLPDDEHDFSAGAYLLDLASGQSTLINTDLAAGSFYAQDFSADSQRLLLWGQDNHVPSVAQFHLYGYDLVREELRDLTADHDLEVGDMLVDDVQQRLSGQVVQFVTVNDFVFCANQRGAVELYHGDWQKRVQPLISGQRHITDFAVATAERGIVFTESTLTTVSRLLYYDLVTGAEKLLYDPNQTYQQRHEFSVAQQFIFSGDQDWPIEGWYLPPITTEKNYPAILYVHGGPQVDYGYTFFHEMQVHAAHGYGVILLNPRGSNSYGQTFEQAVIQHYGASDFIDLMRGVDHVLQLDQHIDPQQLYVTGGSYGGFMTNWIVTQTHRFKAAVTQRSISNWLSFFGTSDIGYYFTPWELSGEICGDLTHAKRLWQFSPLAHVQNVTTPTLVLHGEADLRCPISQGEEFYVALKNHGVATELVRFPQANHELSRSGLPNLRIARLQQIQRWFDQY
ncbi:S9 family peptidase [Loigolactobacillus jiayinensis]|uniref:Alpha/beta fold hydrolase n=1 Tax=Loigolactobacillus jiayinensis TaxID=2486016 RepID=A0ABW1R9Q6_9LACO|nr:S9 family peptidase [Loigolactobacillus jiayinensis]